MIQKWNNLDFEIILALIKSENHLREISKLTKIPIATLSRKLFELRKQNIIDYKTEGKNKVYFLKKNLISQKAVIASENYKCIKLLIEYPKLMTIFEDILEKSNLIILFGSYAKGIPKENSDIDLYMETKENIKNHVIIKGTELYYEKLKFFE